MSEKQLSAEEMHNNEAQKAKQLSKTASREDFQALLDSAKQQEFNTEFVYIKCPEIKKRIKIHNMGMDDHNNMNEFIKVCKLSQEVDPNYKMPVMWVFVLMFAAKNEEGEYIFSGDEGAQFLESQGMKWYKRYGIPALQMSGYTEEFRAAKK